MENPSSPLETLRQLKEMLDSGALTPTEFEALKQRLVFTPAPAGPPPTAATPAAPAAPVAAPPATPAPEVPTVSEAPAWPSQALPAMVPTAVPVASEAPASAAALPPELAEAAAAPPLVTSTALPPAVGAGYELASDSNYRSAPQPAYGRETEPVSPTAPDVAPEEAGLVPTEHSSPLGLILAIGAALVFLAVVAYLGFNRPASEHLTSTSQTAADSVATAIETGPQVAPLVAPPADPETVRIAPAHPAPAIAPRPTATADSVAPAANSPTADSAGAQ